jgi:hypothetical protein
VNREQLTNWHIVETVVYGGYAHANAQKKREFDSWKKMPMAFDMIMNEFVNVTGRMSYWLHEVRKLVEEMVAEVERRQA